jgi:RHS repeat-associated protein
MNRKRKAELKRCHTIQGADNAHRSHHDQSRVRLPAPRRGRAGEGARLSTLRHFPDGTEGQSYWYHYDGRGNVAGLTKDEGQSTHDYRYDAYGQLLPASGNASAMLSAGWTDPHNHYTFGGKEWEENLGLYEFGYRLYDPRAGVWLTGDPLRGSVNRPRTLPRYQYAFASPLSYYDAYGLQGKGPGGALKGKCFDKNLQVDLTGWLPLVLVRNAQAEELSVMREAWKAWEEDPRDLDARLR